MNLKSKPVVGRRGEVPTGCVLLAGLWCLLPAAMAAEAFPAFRPQVIDPQVGKVCYAVALADVNGDQQPDIVAVTENRVLWYQSPNWEPHVMIQDQTPLDNVCIAPHDIDGDGQIDFALGAGWTKTGTLHWIRRGATLQDRWTVHAIGVEPSLHRARWADVLGTGRPQLVISPLNRSEGQGVRLLAFEIPPDPARDRWPATVLNADLNRMHNHWHLDFDGDGSVDTLTASQEGLTLVWRKQGAFQAVRLGAGAPGTEPVQSGAGEIKVGKLAGGARFITSVEPMHGHSVAVYTEPAAAGQPWQRRVIDTGFQRGHGLWTADLDGDGGDEIVFGHSDTPQTFGVIVYRCSDQAGAGAGAEWSRHVVDTGDMATEDLVVGDVTGDGRPDIIAGGRATHNVKLYVNTPGPQ